MQNLKLKFIRVSCLSALIIGVWCCQSVAKPTQSNSIANSALNPSLQIKQASVARHTPLKQKVANKMRDIKVKGLNSKVLELALVAYYNAKNSGLGKNNILSVVDYSLPSTEPRLWVIDLHKNKVLYHTHVAHGKNTGDNYARYFSNKPGSLQSSLGLFITGNMYQGHYGKSMEMHGVDGKFNSNAYSRRIVMHGAHYVDENAISRMGRLGRSFGCLSLNTRVANSIMNTIKGGSYIFCYYPDNAWLKGSALLRM